MSRKKSNILLASLRNSWYGLDRGTLLGMETLAALRLAAMVRKLIFCMVLLFFFEPSSLELLS
jgi:hypothetical protein